MPSPVQISVSQLSRLIGLPDSPVIVDTRIDEDFADDPTLVPGAIRHPFSDVEALAPHLQGQRTVVYCQKGLKISEGSAAVLRSAGIQSEVLESGHFGWRDAGLPMINAAAIPPRNTSGQTVWVTRLRPKIDRIACPWLIRRFVDRNARFLFVAASEVLAVAEKFNATPFDVEDVEWSHQGDNCTFDTMLDKFGLDSPALRKLANIVRGADTDNNDLAPQCAGLLAASLGLSRMYADDLEQLDAGMLIYDAFYRWARDASNERHDWPAPSGKQS